MIQINHLVDARHVALCGLAVLVDVARQRLIVVCARVGQPADVILTQVGVVDVRVCKGREGVNACCESVRFGSLAKCHCDCRALVFRQVVGAAIVLAGLGRVSPFAVEKQRVAARCKVCAEVSLLAGFVHRDGLREEVKAEQLCVRFRPCKVGIVLLVLHQLSGAVAAIPDANNGAVGNLRPVDCVLMVGNIDQYFLAAGLRSICGFFYCVFSGAVCKHLPACRGEVAVQPHQRVGALAVQQHFKMQVRAVHIAGSAAEADDVALVHLLAVLDAIAEQVGVPRLQHTALVGCVLDAHHVAVALHARPGVAVPVLHLIHGAVLGSVDRLFGGIAELRAHVDGLMQAAVVVVPPLRYDVLGQRPAQQHFAV